MSDSEPGQDPEDFDAAEDAIDLSDMDDGIESALAGMPRDMSGADEDGPSGRVGGGARRRRSPALAVIVIFGGLYLLSTMWADFRYWLRGDDSLRDLGQVSDIYRDGAFSEDLDNLYVVVEGTPDVQHAARMKTEKGKTFGYLRLREAGGSLFASVPREDERPHDRFQGRFQGRMRELGSVSNYEIVEQFFNTEEIIRTIDIDPEELQRALEEQRATLGVQGSEQQITLGEEDDIRLVVRQPDVTVQLGKSTWKKTADAEEAIAGLGYPYARLEREAAHFHSFVVRVPESEIEGLRAKLDAGHDVPDNNPDPKVGSMVLPRSATYVVPPEALGVAGKRQLIFEYLDNTTSPGYAVEGERLIERKLADGKLAVDVADVIAVRVQRKIRVDPEGYVITVEDAPSKHWLGGLLFLLVVALVAVNGASLVITFRRRRG